MNCVSGQCNYCGSTYTYAGDLKEINDAMERFMTLHVHGRIEPVKHEHVFGYDHYYDSVTTCYCGAQPTASELAYLKKSAPPKAGIKKPSRFDTPPKEPNIGQTVNPSKKTWQYEQTREALETPRKFFDWLYWWK